MIFKNKVIHFRIFYRFWYTLEKAICSIVCLIAYQFVQFKDHYRGPRYLAAIQDYDNELRNLIKYGDADGSYEDAIDKLYNIMNKWDIKIWK